MRSETQPNCDFNQFTCRCMNRGDVHVLKVSYTKVNSNTVCNYFDFIRRIGLSLAIW